MPLLGISHLYEKKKNKQKNAAQGISVVLYALKMFKIEMFLVKQRGPSSHVSVRESGFGVSGFLNTKHTHTHTASVPRSAR